MAAWFKKGPRYDDQAFLDLSQMFLSCPGDETFRSDLIAGEALDFTIGSLQKLDEYLEAIRRAPPEGKVYQKMVLRSGGYLGEVIRRSTKKRKCHWISYEEADRIAPKFGSIGKSIGSVFCLHYAGEAFTFPLAKICKRISNGEEDNVQAFARVMISIIDENEG